MDYYGTLGPSCQDVETLCALFREGMTGIRLNLSHSGLQQSGQWLDSLRRAAAQSGVQPQLLIDLQGPELRVGELKAPVLLESGGKIRLGTGGIPLPSLLLCALQPGTDLLLDDGAMLLRVERCEQDAAVAAVLRGGTLRSRKSAAAPGLRLSPPTLTQADLENLSLAKRYGVTGVMLPFVRGPKDLIALREALKNAGAPEVQIFAKLENRAGIACLPELLPHADQIVIARGDLGNDLPLWELPEAQKQAAKVCRDVGKPFMVVTQLLHSMQDSAVPTRAEVVDIFNAVLDGACSLMLTGETAAGNYPVQAMRYLVRTAQRAIAYQRQTGRNSDG